MDKQAFDSWLQGYIRAWHTNDRKDIGGLFAEHARYYTGPFDEPWQGREAIISEWINRQDDFRNVCFRYEILAVTGNVGIMRGWTTYLRPPREYSNIWLVHFNEQGQCTEFTEWWVERKS